MKGGAMRKVLFVRRPIVQVALVILFLAVAAVVFTRAQDRAWATSGTVTYNTLPASGAVAGTRNTLRASDAVSETYNTLRVYGDGDWPKQPSEPSGNMGAGSGVVTDEITGLLAEDQPYTDTLAIFNPQLPQAPRKDSITWNPLFMSETEAQDENWYKGLYNKLFADAYRNAWEKVWFRMWYEPEHWDKDSNANGKLDRDPITGEPTDDDVWYPAIMQEFTYLLLDPGPPFEFKPEPTYGLAGKTSFVFPVGMREEDLSDPYGYGLTSLDGDFNRTPPEIVHVDSEFTLFDEHTAIRADFDGDDSLDSLDSDGSPLSGDELVVFRLDPLWISIGEYIQFLDHVVRLEAVYDNGAAVRIWYRGDRQTLVDLGAPLLGRWGMALAGPALSAKKIPAGGSSFGLAWPTGPFFVYLENVDPGEGKALLMVGRALGATHSAMVDPDTKNPDTREEDPWFLKRFYVDGHEYNVVAIKTQDNDKFQFITIRTPIPKVPDVTIHSVVLQDYPDKEPLSVMPPYNYEHYILTDVQAITEFVGDEDDDGIPDEDQVDYLGAVVGPVAPILQKNGPFPYEGAYPDYAVGPYDDPRELYLRWVDQRPNPQLLGELKEKYGERFIEGSVFEVEAEDDPTVTTAPPGAWLSAGDPEEGPPDVVLYSAVPGATVWYTFTGSSITLIHNTQSNAGIANIYMDEWPDGTPYTTVDMYEAVPNNWNEETLIASGLGPGNHTIVVEVTGQPPGNPNVLVDGFRVEQMGEELEFWYVEQWWTRPWEFTEFVLPDIQGETDLYLLTSAFIAPQSEYLYWIQDETFPNFPLRYNLAWDGMDRKWEHVVDTNTITPTLAGWKPRVKFWFDPAVGGRKYKGASSLRIYGQGNEGAGDTTAKDPEVPAYPVEVPPYTDPWAPFNPQLGQAPRKDSLTFNPAYMDRFRNGGEPLEDLYVQIYTEIGDAREKVFFRMWYEPAYLDRIGATGVYTFPALIQEFTYMYLDTLDRPSHGQPGGGSHFAFPIGTRESELFDPFGYGLTTFDADFKEGYETVTIHSERTLSDTVTIGDPDRGIPPLQTDFNGNGDIDPLERDGDELSGDELVVFVLEDRNLGLNESVMFLDYMVTLDNVTSGSPGSAILKFWYTGGGLGDLVPAGPIGGPCSLREGEMAVLGRSGWRRIIAGGDNLGDTDGAWFAYLQTVKTSQPEGAQLTIGRALGATHSAIAAFETTSGDPWYLKRFYVDGHEYNVVAIKTVPADSDGEQFEFKYITIRTPVPKGPFSDGPGSQKLQGYYLDPGVPDLISVMPPFNYAHTRMVDIQRLEEGEFAHPDHYVTGCMGDWEGPVYPLQIQIVDETNETQFFGELKEKLWPDAVPNTDRWSTEQFHTLPDQYTDLDLPAGQLYLLTSDWRSDQSWVHYYGCDPTDGYLTHLQLSDLHTDILTPTEVISFTVDSTVITNTYRAGPLRVKFWYDPDDPDGLYVGTWETTPTCVATADSNSPVCKGDTIQLDGDPDVMASYSWVGPGGWTSSLQNPTRSGATTDMAGTYTLTVTDTHGCVDSDTTGVVVGTDENQGYLDPQHSGVITTCNTTEVEIWVNETDFQGGQIKLQYDPDCADVTNWERNTTDFLYGEWNSDNPGEEQIYFAAEEGLLTGDYLVGTLTIHCKSEEECPTLLDFVDPTMLLDDWSNEIPGTWQDGTFECGVGMCGDVAPYPGCDSKIDWKDFMLLLNYVGHPDDYSLCCEWCGNVAPYPDCDDKIDWKDFMLLLNYVGHPDDYNLCCEAGGGGPPIAPPAVSAAADNEVNLVPQDSRAPSGETTDVEIRVDATNFQGAQIILRYDPDCANVTNWERNQDDFSHGTWNSDNPGEERIYFAADELLTGDYLVGTLTIHCESEGGCATVLEFVAPSMLIDDWGNEIPITWEDGTFKGTAPAAAENEVNLVPQHGSAPFCETADVEIRVNATGFKSGQIKLTYYSACADVTAWVPNTADFPDWMWDSDTPGEEWITFSAQDPMTGTYRIGTLTIHAAYEEGCATVLDFLEGEARSSKLFDGQDHEISANWIDGTFRSVKTYKVYLPLVMKNSQ